MPLRVNRGRTVVSAVVRLVHTLIGHTPLVRVRERRPGARFDAATGAGGASSSPRGESTPAPPAGVRPAPNSGRWDSVVETHGGSVSEGDGTRSTRIGRPHRRVRARAMALAFALGSTC